MENNENLTFAMRNAVTAAMKHDQEMKRYHENFELKMTVILTLTLRVTFETFLSVPNSFILRCEKIKINISEGISIFSCFNSLTICKTK